MITEDYISLDVARLLKEKGFNEPVTELNKLLCREGEKPVLKITHQKAMRWLREVYGLHIWVEYSRFDFNKERPYLWNIVETKIDGDYWGGTYHKTPEEAVDSALKYALENLALNMVRYVDEENAIHCRVGWCDGNLLDYTQEEFDGAVERLGLNIGDKVKVVIIKEE